MLKQKWYFSLLMLFTMGLYMSSVSVATSSLPYVIESANTVPERVKPLMDGTITGAHMVHVNDKAYIVIPLFYGNQGSFCVVESITVDHHQVSIGLAEKHDGMQFNGPEKDETIVISIKDPKHVYKLTKNAVTMRSIPSALPLSQM